MNRKYLLLPALLAIWGISFLGAAQTGTGTSIPAEPGIAFSIRYYDKRIYYLEQDPIFVRVTLTNNGPSPFRFKLADERAFSVDFDVRTTSNRAVAAADFVIRKRSQSQQVYFREISVEAGESFSFVENLRNYAALSEAGSYVVQARIFPELYHAENTALIGPERGPEGTFTTAVSPGGNQAAGAAIVSNRLSLSLRPRPLAGPDGIAQELDVETNAVLVREKLSPDEVVSYLLTARQKSQWEKFFLYLDLEAMLSRDASRQRQWNAESEEGRRRMLSRYREELQGATADGDIALIPMDFAVERTVYNGQSGAVTVLEFFRIGNYTEKKRYTWYLEKRDDIWTIVDYSVINLGTE